MSSKTKGGKTSAKGKRYSAAEKEEILDFVEQVNAEKGRGGQSAASKKYKISPLTISSWLKARKGGSTARSTPRATSAAGSTSAAKVSGPIGKKLDKLQSLHDQIERSEAELAKLRAQFDALKGSL